MAARAAAMSAVPFVRGIFGGFWLAAEIELRESSRDATIAEAGDGASGFPARVTCIECR